MDILNNFDFLINFIMNNIPALIIFASGLIGGVAAWYSSNEQDKQNETIQQLQERLVDKSDKLESAQAENLKLSKEISTITKKFSDLSNLTLIHDKQDHFDEILEDIKKQTCNETEMKGMAELLYANHSIKNEPKLIFEDSSNSIGIQIADLLAGFSTRYYRELLYSSNEINDVYHHIRAVLFNSSEPENGTGINMVLPESVLKNDIISYTYGFKLINT